VVPAPRQHADSSAPVPARRRCSHDSLAEPRASALGTALA